MMTRFEKFGLAEIAGQVLAGERISGEQGLRLFECPDLNAVGELADIVRRRLVGDRASYIRNRYINYSNLCLLSCQFCSFARKKNEAGAFLASPEEIGAMAAGAAAEGATELHIVGGLHPSLPGAYYLDMLDALRAAAPGLHLKVFTAIEIRHLAQRIFRKSIPETLALLREHGLGSLTGGGAEIFDPAVRDQICRGKETAEEWMEVHRTWHQMDGRSTCTMLYGHAETDAQRVDHLCRLRALQDETGGFTGFVPLPFHAEGNTLSHLARRTARDDLKTLAVSRILLDNIRHLTAYWVGLGPSVAQVSLSYGADDLHGTIMEEKIFHMAGASSPQALTVAQLERLITEAGRTPVQRDSHYAPFTTHPEDPHL